MQSPVLFLIFNRPALAAITFERIRSAGPPRLYIHCDGARKDRAGEAELVAACRQLAAQVDWPCTVHTLFRTENLGLRTAVSGALDWFFEQEEMGVIVEDDCLPDPTFFRFCDEMLERYKAHPQVMHIGGSNLLANRPLAHGADSYHFTKFSFVWGWASWRRAWRSFSLDFPGLEQYAQSGDMATWLIDPLARHYLTDKFKTTLRRENHSWAYAWFYTIVSKGGLCIVSASNLIQNAGIGIEGATNTTVANKAAQLPATPVAFPLTHPQAIQHDPRLDTQFFYISQKRRWRLWIWTLLQFFKRLV